ncbi:MAG: MBL fold metallo-hydrolase [Rhodocyclales bacterium]|nr:MBL fold metallo-hydrolase [Rhodocyclales bacterium]
MQLHITHETLPAPGTAVELAPGVKWLRMPLPFALDHINLWLLADGAAWTAIDSGIAVDPIRDIWRAVLATHPLSRLLVTHFHPDHLGLAAWLQEQTGAPLWMTLGEYSTAQLVKHQIAGYGIPAMIHLFRRHGLDEERQAALHKRGNAYGRVVPAIPDTFQRIGDGDRVDIGGRSWRVITGYGHSAEHASLYCDELHVLISGDMLLPRITTNVSAFAAVPEANPLGTFLASIDRFQELPEDTLVLPSHGKPFRGLHERVAQLHAHHTEHFAALRTACTDRPQSATELMGVLFNRDLSDPHQTMFALGESIAHMKYLEDARLVRRVDANGIIRFVNIL